MVISKKTIISKGFSQRGSNIFQERGGPVFSRGGGPNANFYRNSYYL